MKEVTITELAIRGGDATAYPAGQSRDGGGILNYGDLTLDSVTISESQAESGGGVANMNNGALEIRHSSIVRNIAQEHGGGIYDSEVSGQLKVKNSSIGFNDAQKGGGIYSNNLFVGGSIEQSTIMHNRSRDGGGLYLDGSVAVQFTISNSTIRDNFADGPGGAGNGGGLFVAGMTVLIDSTNFLDNEALSKGGGVWLSKDANLSVIGCVISGNTAATGNTLCIQIGAGYTSAFNILDAVEVWVP
jgi:hypothetical protein